jgi:hypothetical protein
MSNDFFQRIIDEGIWAPSGDNSQPWYFKIYNETLNIYITPEVDNPILNVNNSGSYIAHGAMIENMIIAARRYNKELDFTIFPDKNNPKLLAQVKVIGPALKEAYLFDAIRKRYTNRKKYKEYILTDTQRNEIQDSIRDFSEIDLILMEDKTKRREIANLASKMEEIALENRALHKLFFNDIIWKKEDHVNGKMGLHIKTLELPILVQILFKGLKYWNFTKLMNIIGFSKLAAKGNAQIYYSGSAIGIITIQKNSPEDFILAGRALQRIWLTITNLGLALQPVTGIIFLAERIKTEEFKDFEPKHVDLAVNAINKIKSIYEVENKTIAMMFRIGKSDPATLRTNRKAPLINYE